MPWEALRYLTGEISYGGRVTDEWDRRCLKSILNKYFTPSILEDAYKFSESGSYFALPEAPLALYRQYIEKLPYSEKPEVFGLHENADITYQAQETDRFLSTILSIQPRLVLSAGPTGPAQVNKLIQRKGMTIRTVMKGSHLFVDETFVSSDSRHILLSRLTGMA